MSTETNLTTLISPGHYPPLFVISSTDQRGTIVIITWICLVTAIVSLLIRVYVALQAGKFQAYGDDAAITITIILAIVQTALVQGEVSTGLGRTIQDLSVDEAHRIERLQYVDQILFLLCIWLSKIAAVLFIHRLSPKRSDRNASLAFIVVGIVTCIVSMLVVCVVCDIARPWYYFTPTGVTCTAPYGRWIGASVMDITFEVLLACLAMRIVWPLQMSPRKKAVACFMFYQRLIVIVPIAVRLYYLVPVYHGNDPTLQATNSTLCKEVQIAFAIVTSNVPAFRPFLLATATNYGTPAEGPRRKVTSHLTNGRSMKLADMSSSSKQSRTSHTQGSVHQATLDREHFSPNYRNRVATISHTDPSELQEGRSVSSDGSGGMIIRKDVKYNVESYDREDALADRFHDERAAN